MVYIALPNKAVFPSDSAGCRLLFSTLLTPPAHLSHHGIRCHPPYASICMSFTSLKDSCIQLLYYFRAGERQFIRIHSTCLILSYACDSMSNCTVPYALVEPVLRNSRAERPMSRRGQNGMNACCSQKAPLFTRFWDNGKRRVLVYVTAPIGLDDFRSQEVKTRHKQQMPSTAHDSLTHDIHSLSHILY